jgi:hypothetical protein
MDGRGVLQRIVKDRKRISDRIGQIRKPYLFVLPKRRACADRPAADGFSKPSAAL